MCAALGLVSGISTPMVRALISKHSSQLDQGSVFAVTAVLEAASSFAGTFIMNGVYSATVDDTSPGIAFAVGSCWSHSPCIHALTARSAAGGLHCCCALGAAAAGQSGGL